MEDVETITPETARTMLNNSVRNRQLRPFYIKALAKDMQNGRFMLSPHGVCIDTKGRLIDGQHRLLAVLESGVTVRMRVTRNVPTEIIDVIDTGNKRTAGDTLGIHGEDNPKHLAAALGWQYRFENGLIGRFGPSSTTELEDILHNNPEIRTSLAFINNSDTNPKGLMGKGALAWLHFRASRIDPVKAEEFFKKVLTGMDCAENTPPYVFRRRLLATMVERVRPPQYFPVAWGIRAWNAFVRGDSMKNIKFSPDDKFPTFGKKPEGASKNGIILPFTQQ